VGHAEARLHELMDALIRVGLEVPEIPAVTGPWGQQYEGGASGAVRVVGACIRAAPMEPVVALPAVPHLVLLFGAVDLKGAHVHAVLGPLPCPPLEGTELMPPGVGTG
jgi:hypothetical protein